MEQPKYKRVLLKISGEALAGDKHAGLDFQMIGRVCDVVKECLNLGVQVGLVVGGGNFWRGAKDGGGRMERTRADHMGMLATVMNCLAVADVCEQKGIPVRVQTAIEMRSIAEPYIRSRAIRHLEKGRVVIFGAGTGNPYFSPAPAAGGEENPPGRRAVPGSTAFVPAAAGLIIAGQVVRRLAAGVPPVSRPTRPLRGLNPPKGDSECLEF